MEASAPVRLTRYCKAAGCAAKLPAAELEELLDGLAQETAAGFASGIESRDDAGFVELADGFLLQTADFFTPVVDDPYRFGQIAAANALSDVYAMGGEPLAALNLVGFPAELPLTVLREILDGGGAKLAEAGAALCGGHSVRDSEPKYGVAVTGFVKRERLVRNCGARPGDALILTKPLGVGIITTALKRDLLAEDDVAEPLATMARLNRAACAAMQEIGVSAATDVTGFGLLGHLGEMLATDGLGAELSRGAVPVWGAAESLAAGGCYPGGLDSNRAHMEDRVTAEGLDGDALLPLYDPQTSGGLLIAVAPDRAGALVGSLADGGDAAARIGEITAGGGIHIVP